MEAQADRCRATSPGTLVAVVGPSGAGKDSLMAIAARHFLDVPQVHFIQRTITRPADAGGEDHICVSEKEFEAQRQAGGFAVDWDAHGLRYGIPAVANEKLALGHVVVANGSRSTLPRFAKAFSPLLVVNVTASPGVLASRLEARGRESRDEILRRLARSSLEIRGNYDIVTIDNSGALEDAGEQFIHTIAGLLPTAAEI